MRLFVAFEIPEEIRRRVEERTLELRSELPKARWVRGELMHLTLHFLGEVDPELLTPLQRELGTAFATGAPMELTVTGVGAFPPRGRAKVLWAGIETAGDLAGLQASVVAAARRAVGADDDRDRGRPFHPHLTLARCRRPWPRGAVERLAAGFGDDHSRPFTVDHGTLIESRLGPGGPRYRAVESYPLGATR